jgi:hypothetical protein
MDDFYLEGNVQAVYCCQDSFSPSRVLLLASRVSRLDLVFLFPRGVVVKRILGSTGSDVLDENCDNPVTSLSRGKVAVNLSQTNVTKRLTVYVRNEQRSSIVLSFVTPEWDHCLIQSIVA